MKNLSEIEAKTQEVYEQEAQAYTTQRDKSLFEKKWLDIFLSETGPRANVLDVGCGPAEPIARYLIDQGLNLCGVDYSEAMIEIAKSNFPNNEWIVENMISLNLRRKFDGIIAWNSLFHLNKVDQKKAIKVFSQHLNNYGTLLFTAGPDNGEVTGKVNGKDVYHSSFSVEEYEALLKTNGMELINHELNDPECNFHCVFLARKP